MSLQRWMYTLPLRLRSIFHRERVEADLDDELRDHIERQVEANITAGMSHAEARAAALVAFGRVERHKDAVRDTRGVVGIEQFLQDVRFAVRQLQQGSALTVVAVLSLAVGIGTSSAVAGIVQSVLLRPSPYPHADRLVSLFETDPHGAVMPVSTLTVQDWRRASASFGHLAAAGRVRVKVDLNGRSTSEIGAQVSPELFQMLGVRPLRGSVLTTAAHAIVIGEDYWRQRLGSANVVGTTLLVDDTARIITAIMPAAFDFPHDVQLWTPQGMIPPVNAERAIRYWNIVADLRPGVTLAHAQQDMAAIAKHLAEEYPGTNAGVGVKVRSFAERMSGDAKPTLLLLVSIAAMVLLLACVNLANLMLMRGVTRRRELAVRAAVGATPARLRRQILAEALLLCGGAALLGLPITLWTTVGLEMLPQLRSDVNPVNVSIGVVFGVAALLTALMTLLSGLAPAVRASCVDLTTLLKENGERGSTVLGLSGGLITAEVSFATLLLVGSALAMRSLALLTAEPLGFDADRLMILRPSFDRAAPAERLAGERRLLDAIRALPGIDAAAFGDVMPFGTHSVFSAFVEGEPDGNTGWHEAIRHSVSEGYFKTLGVTIEKGHDFSSAAISAPPAVIVNDAFVRAYLAWRDPIGARIVLPQGDRAQSMAHARGEDRWARVIGVVRDVREVEYGQPPRPTAYFLTDQEPLAYRSVVVRTSQPSAVSETLRAAATRAGAAIPTTETPREAMGPGAEATRSRALVVTAFALLALGLASIGVYGVTAHVTAQRTMEIGIRTALGATPRRIFVAVSAHVLRYALVGLGIGLLLALAAARLIRVFLYGIGPADLTAFAAAGIIAAAISCVAVWLPTWRAARVDLTEALRAE